MSSPIVEGGVRYKSASPGTQARRLKKKCAEGKVRSSETGRCRKPGSRSGRSGGRKCPNGYRASLSKIYRKEDGWCAKRNRRTYVRIGAMKSRSSSGSASKSASSIASVMSGRISQSHSSIRESAASSGSPADELYDEINGRQIFKELQAPHRLYIFEKSGKKSYFNSWPLGLQRAYKSKRRN